MLGGACIWREPCVSKSARLILGGKFASEKRLGWLIVERKFMSVILQKDFTDTNLVLAPGGLYSKGRLKGGFFAFFGILRYLASKLSISSG